MTPCVPPKNTLPKVAFVPLKTVFVRSGKVGVSPAPCSLVMSSAFVDDEGSSIGYVVRARILNTLRPRQNGRHFPDDMFKCIFLNENVWISINISLKFVSEGPINNIPALVQIMASRRPGDKPLSEPAMVSLLTHISATQP